MAGHQDAIHYRVTTINPHRCDALLWLAITKPPAATGYAIAVITLLTAFVSWIAFRTVVLAVRRQLFPRGLPAEDEGLPRAARRRDRSGHRYYQTLT